MFPARFAHASSQNRVRCTLCPHNCLLAEGESGICRTRINHAGQLCSENHGVLSAVALDPVEKKPLYHFLPGKGVLSIGSFGCNLRCEFCQNCHISQAGPENYAAGEWYEASDLIRRASGSSGIAYTYNEPTVFFEFMMETAALAHARGLKNVVVSNGFINTAPLAELIPLTDAFNIDLKAFSDDFYQRLTGGRLKPVLDSIAAIANAGKHLELTFLIIPGHNDRPDEWRAMIDWIFEHCGSEQVLHVSRYFPRHNMQDAPTPASTIEACIHLAREKLHYVYPGNLPHVENHTLCPDCGALLIDRFLYETEIKGLDTSGRCRNCGHKVPGVFK